jgi:hypothetical protein
VVDAAFGGHAERDVQHSGRRHSNRHRVVAQAPLGPAQWGHLLVAPLEIDQHHAYHAGVRDALRVGAQAPDVAGVADRKSAHRMRRGRVECKIGGELAHELAEAALSIDHDQAPALLHHLRLGVDEELPRAIRSR